MTPRDVRFVFFGAQGEYVLSPLFQEMSARGFRCHEVVARDGRDAAAEIAAMAADPAPTVLISCAHLLHDQASMLEFLGIPNCPPFLQVRRDLDPVLTVYYTHDLSSPFIWDEQQCLAQIDLYLAAMEFELMFRRQTQVEYVGWIKLRARAAPAERRGRAVWLTMGTETIIQKIGVEESFKRYKPFLRDWCAIKLPPYDYCRPLEDLIRAEGVPVIDCFETPPDVAPQYDVVVSNGMSSVVRETGMMGKPVFVMTDPGIFPQASLGALHEFSDMPNVRLVRDMDEIPETVRNVAPRLKPFDMDAAIAAILGRLGAPG